MIGTDYRRPGSDPWTLHPDGFVVRGCNMVPNGTGWNQLWIDWPWDTWLRPQIDKAVRAGCNTVRFFGSHRALIDGAVTTGQMTSRWQQWAEYAIGKGLAIYPCLGDDFGADSVPMGTVRDTSVAQAAALSAYASRCIGMDNLQERNGYQATNGAAIIAAVRAVAPTIPLTHSGGNYGGVDFLDYHSYGRMITRAGLIGIWNVSPTKKLLLGEFGSGSTETYATQRDYYAYAEDLVTNFIGPGGQRLAGALAWAITDQGLEHFGMWDSTFDEASEETGMTEGLSRFPTVRAL